MIEDKYAPFMIGYKMVYHKVEHILLFRHVRFLCYITYSKFNLVRQSEQAHEKVY